MTLGFGGHPMTLIPLHDSIHAPCLAPQGPMCGFVVPVCEEEGSMSQTWGRSSGDSSHLNVFHKDLGSLLVCAPLSPALGSQRLFHCLFTEV